MKLINTLLLKSIIKSSIWLSLLLLIPSCSFKRDISKEDEKDNRLIVLTTFTVIADMAKNVSGDRLIIDSITKPGSEIHTYQFTPSDLIKVKDADLLLENGLGLELWINKFTSNNTNLPRVVLSKGMKPILIEGDVYSGKPNPHAWMSPKRAISYVDKIVEAFIEIDPEGKDVFIKNSNRYKTKLLRLDKDLKKYISSIPEEKRFLVTCEGAFSYLASDYGMKEAYLWPVNSENQVTPRRMANLIKTIKENNIKTIFCETTVSSRAQKQVAKASGAVFGGDFYVDSLSQPDGDAPTLLELQRFNAKLLIKGLGVNQ